MEQDEDVSGHPDALLVAAAVAGDRKAFGTLLATHYDRMHRVAWRMTGSRTDAEDIVQDVCCALVDKIAGFRGECRFSTWVIGIVANACKDQRRRAGTFARMRQGFLFLAGLDRADGRDLFRGTWIASAISKLSPEIREAVILVAGEGLSHKEASLVLACAESTVSWRLHEARKQLRALDMGEEFN